MEKGDKLSVKLLKGTFFESAYRYKNGENDLNVSLQSLLER